MPVSENPIVLKRLQEEKVARVEREANMGLKDGTRPPPEAPVPKPEDMVPTDNGAILRHTKKAPEGSGIKPQHIQLPVPVPVEYLGDQDRLGVVACGAHIDFKLDPAYATDDKPEGRRVQMIRWADVLWYLSQHPHLYAIPQDIKEEMETRKILAGLEAHREVVVPALLGMISDGLREEVAAIVDGLMKNRNGMQKARDAKAAKQADRG